MSGTFNLDAHIFNFDPAFAGTFGFWRWAWSHHLSDWLVTETHLKRMFRNCFRLYWYTILLFIRIAYLYRYIHISCMYVCIYIYVNYTLLILTRVTYIPNCSDFSVVRCWEGDFCTLLTVIFLHHRQAYFKSIDLSVSEARSELLRCESDGRLGRSCHESLQLSLCLLFAWSWLDLLPQILSQTMLRNVRGKTSITSHEAGNF